MGVVYSNARATTCLLSPMENKGVLFVGSGVEIPTWKRNATVYFSALLQQQIDGSLSRW